MNQKDLEITCQHFGIGEPQFIRTVAGGLIHKMWQIKTQKGTFAIKELSSLIKFDDKIRNSYEESEAVASIFSRSGIPAISAISIGNKALFETNGRYFLCYPWFVGKTLKDFEIKDLNRVKMAKILADIHKVSAQLFGEKAVEFSPNCNLYELFIKVLSTDPAYKKLLIKHQDILLEVANLYNNAIKVLPKVGLISHTDLDPKNVMWNDNNPNLIDWESAKSINPTQDVIQLAIDWSREGQIINWNGFKTIIEAFIKNGGAIDPRVVTEATMLILGNALDWLAFNLKRSIDPESSDKELSVIQVNETIRSIVYLYRSIDQVQI